MTNEQAARILDPATSREALAPYAHNGHLLLAVTEEACAVAAKVLRGPDIRTNADRIRSLSDEELAYQFGAQCPKENKRACDNKCHLCWLGWLLEPAEED